MINRIKRLGYLAGILVFSGTIFLSCESDADELGSQFFDDNAEGTVSVIPVIAYNANNNDSIRSDAARLDSATLGVFKENVFGKQRASYVTQARLSTYSPSFGDNAKVDSVVLSIKPSYYSDDTIIEDNTSTDEDYTYVDEDGEETAATKVVVSYPVKKYGDSINASFNIKVESVEDFLESSSTVRYSNESITTGTLLGTKSFDGFVRSVKITDASNSSTTLLSRDATIRIPLSADYFQSKIIDKEDSYELDDAASFIRYFRGLKISVDDTDIGYLIKFAPNTCVLNVYYSYESTSDGTTTEYHSSFAMDLGSNNAHIGLYDYDRSNSTVGDLAYSGSTSGDPLLYTQGMGGPGINIKIPAAKIQDIKKQYETNGAGIISAKIRLYRDENAWDTTYRSPSSFVVKRKYRSDEYKDKPLAKDSDGYLNVFMSDMTTYVLNYNFNLVSAYLNQSPAYYDISITDTLMDAIESTDNVDLELNLNTGYYTYNSTTGYYTGGSYTYRQQYYNSRSYTPNRTVLVGTDSSNANYASLRVVYATKN